MSVCNGKAEPGRFGAWASGFTPRRTRQGRESEAELEASGVSRAGWVRGAAHQAPSLGVPYSRSFIWQKIKKAHEMFTAPSQCSPSAIISTVTVLGAR